MGAGCKLTTLKTKHVRCHIPRHPSPQCHLAKLATASQAIEGSVSASGDGNVEDAKQLPQREHGPHRARLIS
eukprot:9604860-Prorocentrum_lima.AAC.1